MACIVSGRPIFADDAEAAEKCRVSKVALEATLDGSLSDDAIELRASRVS